MTGRFLAWALFGVLVAFAGLCSISSLIPLLLIIGPLIGFIAWRVDWSAPDPARWGLAFGLAALPLFLAYMNRHGPGDYCEAIGTPRFPGEKCTEEWDPRPFLAVGLALCAASISGALWQLRNRRRSPSPS
ncbi:MAG: hypothetical protein QOF68_1090 [Gaiellales bacterium]|nr:hypothetical protein [Gaiellales bacterium]